jgi:cell division protein FtsN
LSYFVVAVAAGIFVAVAGLLVYAVVQSRKETDDDHSEPAQVYGSNEVEIAWTVIPSLRRRRLMRTERPGRVSIHPRCVKAVVNGTEKPEEGPACTTKPLKRGLRSEQWPSIWAQ